MALLLLPSSGCLQGPNPACMAVRWGCQQGQSIQGAVLSRRIQSSSVRALCEVSAPEHPLSPVPGVLQEAGILSMP